MRERYFEIQITFFVVYFYHHITGRILFKKIRSFVVTLILRLHPRDAFLNTETTDMIFEKVKFSKYRF